MSDSWPFDQPPNCATVTTSHVMIRGQLITKVSHDENDHGWQFHSSDEVSMEDAMVVSLKEVIALDDTLLELADLPPGWAASRSSKNNPWNRSPIKNENFESVVECGVVHGKLPHISSPVPYQWRDELASDKDSLLTEDLCIIEGEDFFVRGVIEIPICDSEDSFGWGVWVSLKKENFELYREQYDSAEIGPFFGWLSTGIDFFSESTLNLKASVKFIGEGQRPRIFLNESEHQHQLRIDQQDGITIEQAWEIVHNYKGRD